MSAGLRARRTDLPHGMKILVPFGAPVGQSGRQGKEKRLIKFLGNRGASAVMGMFMFALVSSEAGAAPAAMTVQAGQVDGQARPLGGTAVTAATRAALPVVASVTQAVLPTRLAQSITTALVPDIATEAAWLARNGWHLASLVDRYATGAPLTDQAQCIAVAVYHEARGETLEGQLAVAKVIMNRAASGKYPSSWCGVVKQPWQFSFVNPKTGDYPAVNEASAAWKKALGITRLAVAKAVPSLTDDVLWYHADYVAPSWGRRLTRVDKIGAHI